MTQYLPPNLLALFAPREPISFLPPPDKLPHEKKTAGYQGIGAFIANFEDPKETPPPMKLESREERQERKRREKAEQVAYKLEQDIALWDPHNNPNGTVDPYKTLFIARINYDTTESKLRREFEVYGAVKKINLVLDRNDDKPRGYAFIEYEHERDMHSAYKHGDGKKIDGKRVLVDVERGRIVKGWLPRRLGGGMGGTRRGGPEVNVKHSGREDSRLDGSYLERDRDRPERGERDRDRSERRERKRSRSRERGERKRRSRSRDRSHRDRAERGGRDRSMGEIVIKEEPIESNGTPHEVVKKRERRRSRSRERGSRSERGDRSERKRRRSRSKSRDRKRADREERRERDKERSGGDEGGVIIKTEPVDEGYNQAEFGTGGGGGSGGGGGGGNYEGGDSNSFSNSYTNNGENTYDTYDN